MFNLKNWITIPSVIISCLMVWFCGRSDIYGLIYCLTEFVFTDEAQIVHERRVAMLHLVRLRTQCINFKLSNKQIVSISSTSLYFYN